VKKYHFKLAFSIFTKKHPKKWEKEEKRKKMPSPA
jgi:hypothetical protein